MELKQNQEKPPLIPYLTEGDFIGGKVKIALECKPSASYMLMPEIKIIAVLRGGIIFGVSLWLRGCGKLFPKLMNMKAGKFLF
ncbi:MAG: hypothetical protein DDT23_00816 [candidate division WS2 bacterium]|nr:hypothetical protein [Candidatus Lithacetigena glycinireducens]